MRSEHGVCNLMAHQPSTAINRQMISDMYHSSLPADHEATLKLTELVLPNLDPEIIRKPYRQPVQRDRSGFRTLYKGVRPGHE
jgi:hypothetical protein